MELSDLLKTGVKGAVPGGIGVPFYRILKNTHELVSARSVAEGYGASQEIQKPGMEQFIERELFGYTIVDNQPRFQANRAIATSVCFDAMFYAPLALTYFTSRDSEVMWGICGVGVFALRGVIRSLYDELLQYQTNRAAGQQPTDS